MLSDESQFCLGANDGRVLLSTRLVVLLQPTCPSVHILPDKSPDISTNKHVWDIIGHLQHQPQLVLFVRVLTDQMQ